MEVDFDYNVDGFDYNVGGKLHSDKPYMEEEDSDVWGPDDMGMSDAGDLSPFQVNPFSSGAFADELFGFSDPNSQDAQSNAGESYHSIITENSSSSTVSTLPFPFYNRPEIPHVDEFVLKNKLHYSNLRLLNMYEKKCKIVGPYGAIKKQLTEDFVPGKRRIQQESRASRVSDEFDDDSMDPDSTLSNRQIKQFVKYILVCVEGEKVDINRKITGISYQDMVNALRMHARDTKKFGGHVDYTQELLMASCDDLLFRSNLSHIEWFDANCQGIAGGEYKMTTLQFNRSIRYMCEEHGLPLWTNSDLKVLRLHMSPEGEYEPNLQGVMRAVRKFYSTNEERAQFEAARPIISKIKRLMRSRKHRVIDFFVLIERNISEPVAPKKLMAAIKQLLVTRREDDPNESIFSYPESNGGATARTFDTTCGSISARGGAFRPSLKKLTPLEPLEPLSQELISRIATIQEDIQKRLYQAVSSSGQTLRQNEPDATPFDNLSTATISFAMKSTAGKMLLDPIVSPSPPPRGTDSLMNTLSSALSSPLNTMKDMKKTVNGNGKNLKSQKLTFNLSPSFNSMVEQRTQKLVTSLKQYDQKREHNLSRLAALY